MKIKSNAMSSSPQKIAKQTFTYIYLGILPSTKEKLAFRKPIIQGKNQKIRAQTP